MWKKKRKKFRRVSIKHASYWEEYKREAAGILLSAVFIFFAISIFSYSPQDNTFFHYSSSQFYIINWGGIVGANVAAFLIYFLGFASYLVLFCLMVPAYRFLFKKYVKSRLPQKLCYPLLIASGAALCSVYEFFGGQSLAGGVIGSNLKNLSYFVVGFYGTIILLWAIFWASLTIIFQTTLLSHISFSFKKSVVWIFQKGCIVLRILCIPFVIASIKMWFMFKRLAWWRKRRRLCCSGKPINDIIGSTKSENLIDIHFWDDAENHQGDGSPENLSDQKNKLIDASEKYEIIAKRFATKKAVWLGQPFDSYSGDHKKLKRFLINTVFSKNIFSSCSGAERCSYLELMEEFEKINFKGDERFNLPDLSLFQLKQETAQDKQLKMESEIRSKKLEEKLQHFGVKGSISGVRPGPIITMFEYKPEIDSKISKIISLEDDLALALKAISIRIIAPIPGESAVGFEIANTSRRDVFFSQTIKSAAFSDFDGRLPLALGVDVVGNPVVEDLVKMPHLLVGGATGSGKSVGLNATLASLLCKCTPKQLRLILIDPKRLEFTPYDDIPHLLFPIVTNPVKATAVLKWVVQEMEDRYERMAQVGVRNITEYQKLLSSNRTDKDGQLLENMPFIVVVIDELADLMIVAGKEIETYIVRIAQMARAAGIHMIVATQRPSVDVVTGLIKVNFPSRVSFRVSSKVDSRTILDQQGAEKLLGRGDMLFMNSASSHLARVHGAYISDKEIESLTTHLKSQEKVTYLNLHEVLDLSREKGKSDFEDELYDEILNFIKTKNEISISMIQRQYRIGFNRSARIIEKLEMDGLLAPAQGSKPRKVLR